MALAHVILNGLGTGANGHKLATFGYASGIRVEYPALRVMGLTTRLGSRQATTKLGSRQATTKLGSTNVTVRSQQ